MGRGGPLSASAAVRQETQTSAWAWHARSPTRVISADGSHRVSQARALSPVSNLYPPCYAYAFLNLHPPFRKPHRPPAAKSGPVNVRPPCALMGFLLFCCSLFSSSRPFILLPQNTLTLLPDFSMSANSITVPNDYDKTLNSSSSLSSKSIFYFCI